MSKIVRAAAVGAAIAVPIGAYVFIVRPWVRRWGVEPGAAGAVLPGDGLVEDPTVIDTRTIEIDAAPQDVWPWLVQMGYGRAGWYSYDQLDQKGRSADEIVPEWQGLAVGDTVPTHPGGGFAVKILEPARALVLYVDSAMAATWRDAASAADEADEERTDDLAAEAMAGQADEAAAKATAKATAGLKASGAMLGTTMPAEFAGSWAFVLEPTGDGRTKLIERLRFRFSGPQAVGTELAMEAMGFGVFLMMRRQMLGIRGRSERLAQTKLPVPVPMGTVAEPLPA
jgi:hypothetical protein